MLRALLLLACTAKVAAFAQTPAGEAGCVDMDPDVIQSAFAEAIQDVEGEAVPTITSCADMASNGGCADETVSASCCASCALPQRMTYGSANEKWVRFMNCMVNVIRFSMDYGRSQRPVMCNWAECDYDPPRNHDRAECQHCAYYHVRAECKYYPFNVRNGCGYCYP